MVMKIIRLALGNILFLSSVLFKVGAFTGPLPACAEPAFESSQAEIRKVEAQLSTEREKLRSLGHRERDMLAELTLLEAEVAEKRGAVNDLSEKIRHANAEVDALRRTLLNLRQSSMESQNKISKRLVEFYKHARNGYVKALTDIMDITDFLRRAKYVSIVMAQDRANLVRAAEEAKAHQNKISKTEVRMSEVEDRNRKEEACLVSLKKELEKKVLLLVKIHEEKKFYETEVQELENSSEGLKQTLIDIEKKDAYETTRPFPFEEFKGKLPYPMRGKVLNGQDLVETFGPGTFKGIIIEGPSSSDVMAIFPGRVAFSGTLKGYGELVIINHGSRFFTVSAHLTKRNKIEGEIVKEGDVVGRVGGNGFSEGGGSILKSGARERS
jgi:septal ring factor EnvC (AmiA/AmiB activator)